MCLKMLHTRFCAVKTNDARFRKERQKETPYRFNTIRRFMDSKGVEPSTFRMRTERSPNSLAFVHTLCTVRKENQRIFVHIKRPAIPTAFLGRKYDLQAADFQDDAVWGVIWLADK